nr:Retrovirus-related Pol polyprotein from transposon RE1 [Ipomoea batatas]
MDDEFEVLQRQRTWVLIPSPPNRFPIGSKWVYRIKRNFDGFVYRYKDRLVAKGYDQEYDLEYSETVSPVVKQQTIRVVLSIAMHHQHSAQGTLILLLYVDDIVITGSSTSLIHSFIRSMHHEFQMKDLGPLKYFLGLEVQCTTNRLLLYQTKYASELIHRAGVDSTTTAPSPISPSTYTNGVDTLFSNPRMFHSLVSGLQYLTVTKPDIQYAVNYVAQKMHNPTDQDFHTLKHILRYRTGEELVSIPVAAVHAGVRSCRCSASPLLLCLAATGEGKGEGWWWLPVVNAARNREGDETGTAAAW